jgi:aminopeptidase N
MRFIFIFLFLQSALVHAQNHSCQSAKRHVPLRGGGSASDPANMRSDTLDVLHYDISINMRAMASAQISAVCRVDLVSLMDNVASIHLDLKALQVDSVYGVSGSLAFAQGGESLWIQPELPLQTGDTLQVWVAYHGQPAQDASWGGFYFSSGYAYNLGVGFDAVPHNFGRVWFPCFDNFVERSTYSFHVLTTEIKSAYCSGIREGVEVIGQDSILTHWRLDQVIPTYLAGIAAASYAHAELYYTSTEGNEIPMWLIAAPADTTNMKNSFTHLDEAMASFENRFGPYRWSKVGFSAVPFNAGAMEHATNIAYPRSTLDGTTAYETLMAHELSHHWWGDLVTCETAGDMWLNEGWASFCEMVFTEALYGSQAYTEAVRDNHKDVLLNAHRNDGGRYAVSGVPLNITYGDHVYNKGADIARTLRSYMGDDDFFEACRAWMSDRSFQHARSPDLRDFFQDYTEANLTYFFGQWFFVPGFPEFLIHSFTNMGADMWDVHIKQFSHYNSLLMQEVPLDVTFFDAELNRTSVQVIANGANSFETVQLPNGFEPVHACLDPSDKLALAVLAEERTIDNNGPNDCDYAEMDIVVSDLPDGDSVFVRVENHWAQADESLVQGDYYISPDRWWNVFRSGDTGTLAATIRYYGDSVQSRYFDPLFFEYLETFGYNEDSIVLLHRTNPIQPWSLFSDYELITTPSIDNWQGRIKIGNLLSGQYTWAVPNSPLLHPEVVSDEIKIYTSSGKLHGYGLDALGTVAITDNSGRTVYSADCEYQFTIDTVSWATGIYHLHIGSMRMNRIHTFKVYIP